MRARPYLTMALAVLSTGMISQAGTRRVEGAEYPIYVANRTNSRLYVTIWFHVGADPAEVGTDDRPAGAGRWIVRSITMERGQPTTRVARTDRDHLYFFAANDRGDRWYDRGSPNGARRTLNQPEAGLFNETVLMKRGTRGPGADHYVVVFDRVPTSTQDERGFEAQQRAQAAAAAAAQQAAAAAFEQRRAAQAPIVDTLGVLVVEGGRGVQVDWVMPGSPAETAGIGRGDQILDVNNIVTNRVSQLMAAVGRSGQTSQVTMNSRGNYVRLRVARPGGVQPTGFTARPAQSYSGSFDGGRGGGLPEPPPLQVRFGATVASSPAGGVIVRGVAPGSVAAQHLRPGDVVIMLAGQPTRSKAEFDRVVSRLAPGETVTMTYGSGRNPGRSFTVDVTP